MRDRFRRLMAAVRAIPWPFRSAPAPEWLVIAILALAGMSASFMQTIVVPIQAQLPELLAASREDTAWVITVTLLSAAISTPIAGRLGDMYGKRRVALGLLTLLVVGSVVAALSHGLIGLLLGRALQGAVFGIIPLGIAIMRDVLHPNRLGGAVALMSATLGVGAALGLPISAIVSEVTDWHMLFWIAAGLGAANFVLFLWIVPVSTLKTAGHFDFLGALGLSIGLTGVLLAISRGDVWGWASAATLACGLGGIMVLWYWGWRQLRTPNALVDLRVAARPAVLLTNLASVALGFALFSSQVSYPQLLGLPAAAGAGLGLTLLATSIVLMPAGLVMMLMSPISARLQRRFGARPLLISGSLAILVAYTLSLFLRSEWWHIMLANVMIGIGIGLAYAAMPLLIMRAVPANETAAANGINSLMRSFGTSVAAALVGAILSAWSTSSGGVSFPTDQAFQITFLLGGIAALAAASIAFFIPTKPVAQQHPALPEGSY